MPDPADVVVGIDIGSSSVRAVAITGGGHVVDSGRAGYQRADAPVGEADPNGWLKTMCDAISNLDSRKPTALGVGGQGPATVASSGDLAVTFRHPLAAGDSPPEQHAAQVQLLRERLGHQVQPRLPWDWLLSRLGGRSDTQSVWPGLEPLEGFGAPVPVGSNVGMSNGDHGLDDGITLAPGSNDFFLTAWAAGINVPGTALDPGGQTGGFGVAVEAEGDHQISAYGLPSAVPGVVIIGGPTAAHGTLLDWWSDTTGRGLAELLELAAEVPAGSDGVMALPFLEGERAPRWNPHLRAEIVGLGTESHIGIVTRALLESTAYGLAHIAQGLLDQGAAFDRLVCCGGPSRSHLWSSIKSAVLEVPVHVPECTEMAAYGAALSAGAAVGWWPRPGEGSIGDWPIPEMEIIEAEPLDVYREGLKKFIALGDEAESRLN